MSDTSAQKKRSKSCKLRQAPFDPGPTPDKSNTPELKVNIEDTISKVCFPIPRPTPSLPRQPQLSIENEESVTLGSVPLPRRKIWKPRIQFFQDKFPDYEIVRDIGSGLNFKRKGFLSILDSALRGDIEEIAVTHKDRLCRFGYEMLERIVRTQGGKILVLNEQKLSPEQELVQDLLTITTVFSARLYGLRSHSLQRQIRHAGKTKETSRQVLQDLTSESLSEGE